MAAAPRKVSKESASKSVDTSVQRVDSAKLAIVTIRCGYNVRLHVSPSVFYILQEKCTCITRMVERVQIPLVQKCKVLHGTFLSGTYRCLVLLMPDVL